MELRKKPRLVNVACRVVQQGKRVELHSPFFVFFLDTTSGLRAESWENRLTGRHLPLGNGPELAFDIGLPENPVQTPQLDVSRVEVKAQGETGEVVFQLTAKEPTASAVVTYRWDAKQPVLRKFVTIINRSRQEWNRLLNVRLGRYDTGAAQVRDTSAGGMHSAGVPREFPSTGGTDVEPGFPSYAAEGWSEAYKSWPRNHVERGFPAYAVEEFFFTLAHPAGAAEGSGGGVSLRQYPGARLPAGKTFKCMEAVYGVAKAATAGQAFVAYVQSRMRRVVRGHDKPYAIFDPAGAKPDDDYEESEDFLLNNIAQVAQGQRETGCRFDLYSLEHWIDYRGTFKDPDPKRFPNGLALICRELDKLGIALGLWFMGSITEWSIGKNPSPDVQACLHYDVQKPETLKGVQAPQMPSFCLATEPIRSMYKEAFRYHIRQNGVRMIKFDGTACICVNPKHEHLPGLYSTEAIEDALIEYFRTVDAECPDVFLMLYWGYRSPWWLLHADTLFDSGISGLVGGFVIEAANPSDQPAPYARDSVTQMLDQSQWLANKNVPPLGKDSLGVWLSDWGWNSQIGKERWQSGFLMDICRGSLLAQPWSDTPWLSPPERKEIGDFIALLKARPECFRNSRFILGDPNKDEPYGYCCTDGRRAFLALYNCCWKDSVLPLQLNSAWGLPDGQVWDLYRWYPDPARLSGQQAIFGNTVSIALRPFEIILLEVVPPGQAPTLDRRFESKPIPTAFTEPSQSLDITVKEVPTLVWAPLSVTTAEPPFPAPKSTEPRFLVLRGQVPASPRGGMLIFSMQAYRGSQPMRVGGVAKHLAALAILAGQTIHCEPVLGMVPYPCYWQAWRVAVGPSNQPQSFELAITVAFDPDVRTDFKGYILPK